MEKIYASVLKTTENQNALKISGKNIYERSYAKNAIS